MNRDKANLIYPFHGKPHEVTAELSVFAKEALLDSRGTVSRRTGRWILRNIGRQRFEPRPVLRIPTTMERVPGQVLLVVACDLPLLDESIPRTMIEHRGAADALAFRSSSDGLPEPLRFYEPTMLEVCGPQPRTGPDARKLLMQNASSVQLLELPVTELDNANDTEDFDRLCRRLEQKTIA